METEQIDESQRDKGEEGQKTLTKEFICTYVLPMNIDNRMMKAWDWVGTVWRSTMEVKRETPVILSTIKVFKK